MQAIPMRLSGPAIDGPAAPPPALPATTPVPTEGCNTSAPIQELWSAAEASDENMNISEENTGDLPAAEGPGMALSQQMVAELLPDEGPVRAHRALAWLGKRSLLDAGLQVHCLPRAQETSVGKSCQSCKHSLALCSDSKVGDIAAICLLYSSGKQPTFNMQGTTTVWTAVA